MSFCARRMRCRGGTGSRPNPRNVFARIASGVTEQPNMKIENESLGSAGSRFMVCSNMPQNDEHWNSNSVEWVGKASMSSRHRFLTIKDLSWKWFNVLAFGLDGSVPELKSAIECLKEMKSAAEAFASATYGCSKDDLGLFFHVYPHNSVQSLHMHMLDMRNLGPTYHHLMYKNMPLVDVLTVLQNELTALEREK